MYRIIGADGREYGPITADQLRQWIAEGRANAQTKVLAEGATEWKTLADFPEFIAPPPGAAPTPGAVPPPPPMPSTPVPSVAVTDQVNGPAIGLIVVAILGFFLLAVSLVFKLTGFSILGSRPMPNDVFSQLASGSLAIALNIIGLLWNGLVLWGGIKMNKLESYPLAMTGSIVAMLPCSACCIAGLPIGIWSLVVLSKPEVKAAFPQT